MNAKIEYFVKEYKECDHKEGRQRVKILAKSALYINEYIKFIEICNDYLSELYYNLINK